MNKSHKSNIYNIPAHYHFFESLFDWLEENFPKELSQVKIFLPNQRSCRELRQVFLEKNKINHSLILPKIKAISDLSFEDFFDFLPQSEVKEIISEILKIKVISGIDHLFFLSQEITKLSIFGENLDAAQALSISFNLKNLFEEIENSEIDLKKLFEIDESNLSNHRQITLDFLKSFHIHLKNALIKNNIFFLTSYQNFLVKKFSETLRNYPSKNPLIIAGSTGSISSSKSLIGAIRWQKNGFVILYGADLEQDFLNENHPQFYLNNLIKFLQIDKKQITQIAKEKFLLSSKIRQKLLSLLMLPAEKTYDWQSLEFSHHEEDKNISKAVEKISIVKAESELEEAKIIALILANNFSQEKKFAVISNNKKFVKLLKYELENLSVSFNDSRNVGIFNSNLVNFVLLILDLIESDFSSSAILSVIQNPLCDIKNKTIILSDFELKILRQDRIKAGLDGILDKLKNCQNSDLENFFSDFYSKIDPLHKQRNLIDISSFSRVLIKAIEDLSNKKFTQILENENCQKELFEFFTKLTEKSDFIINPKNSLTLFKILFSQISFFEKSEIAAPIQILSTIEARLLNFDLAIVAGLNEGNFPEIESENWLGKKIKKDLEIDKKLKKIGQNAYDFCNYLSNPEVILSLSLNIDGKISSPSPFLLKLETLCKKLNLEIVEKFEYYEFLRGSNQNKNNKIARANPKPEIEFRPKKLAITDISKLISDPYTIYAKRILKLIELQEIDFEPSYAEFGSFVHKALEQFIKNPQNLEKSLKIYEKLFEEYFLSQEARLIWWPKFKNIFSAFLVKEKELQAIKNLTEFEVKIILKNILIRGKIDRIAFLQNNLIQIFDYKTGQTPSNQSVILGKEPQLTISALMLIENQFSAEISSLNYWKLSFSGQDEIKSVSKDSEEIKTLAAAAKVGLQKLLSYFADKNNGYLSAPNLDNYQENEYSHLARIKKWQ